MLRFLFRQIKQIGNYSMSSISIASQEETLQFFRQKYGSKTRTRKIYGFYSSDFNKIITDEHHMLIPIDERMATRAHAVFDVIYAKKLNLINLQAHVNRLFKSSDSVSIKPPFDIFHTQQTIIGVMKEILKKMMEDGISKQSLMNKVFGIRLTVSSGYGDFGIVSLGKKPVFYMSVFEPYINYDIEKEGVNDYVVKFVDDTISDLVHTKTVNYIDNALMANKSKALGGYQGIKARNSGVLLQASMANIAFMFGKQFATPRFETVIQGTTIKKLLKYIQELKQEGKIEKISFRDITIQQVQNHATEMMILGGDKIVPVLSFNGRQISQKKGVFTQMFQDWYEQQNEVATPIFD